MQNSAGCKIFNRSKYGFIFNEGGRGVTFHSLKFANGVRDIRLWVHGLALHVGKRPGEWPQFHIGRTRKLASSR